MVLQCLRTAKNDANYDNQAIPIEMKILKEKK